MPRHREYPELAAELARRGLTQREFAEAVDVHPNTVYGILNGLINPTPGLRERIGLALERPPEELFADEVTA